MTSGPPWSEASDRTLSPGRIAQVACLLEATARKPGNVHRFADSPSLHYLDFLLSATAVAGPLDRARSTTLGATILAAVEATRRVVSTNTNLGILLLLAPLAAVDPARGLEEGVEAVLSATTVEDARLVYRAIRLAEPGGLGRAGEQDLAAEPTVSLRRAMALAADRDLIARQYRDGFHEVLHEALPVLRKSLSHQPLEPAILTTFLSLLATHPDSLILRKHGPEAAAEVSGRARAVLDADWPETGDGAICDLDRWLRSDANRLNPGTTADLVTAALYAALREGTILLPLPAGGTGWSAQPFQV
jgi:triphosphoribosyl-dephospho-CoA synthase